MPRIPLGECTFEREPRNQDLICKYTQRFKSNEIYLVWYFFVFHFILLEVGSCLFLM
jgi:hypothetical protein